MILDNYPFKSSLQNLILIVGILFLILIFLGTIYAVVARAEELKASWYSIESLKQEGTWKISKGRCADGSYFNDNNFTCACRLYPLGALLRVTNLDSGKSVLVRVTDRIGIRFARTRIDLSKMAFLQLGKLERGLISVKVEKIQ